jgi:hypothetical protein
LQIIQVIKVNSTAAQLYIIFERVQRLTQKIGFYLKKGRIG